MSFNLGYVLLDWIKAFTSNIEWNFHLFSLLFMTYLSIIYYYSHGMIFLWCIEDNAQYSDI